MPAAKTEAEQDAENQFEWIKLREAVDSCGDETLKQKFARKTGDNPIVPIGCLLTLGALSYGLWSFRQGNKKMSQYMMRARVVAQGFTITALIVGLGITAARTGNK